MSACPCCFRELSTGLFRYTCIGACAPTPDPVATALNGYPVNSRSQWEQVRPPDANRRWSPSPMNCGTCGGETRESCPVCHFLLPPDWRAGHATKIALAGARATGKSVYIGVVVKQMELLAQMLNSTLSPATAATRSLYEEYYEKPLYDQRGILPSTPRATTANSPQREPLIFSLGRVGGITRYVVLRDVAGEELEEGVTGEQHLSFFAFADAVLFMFDPLRVDAVRHILHDVIPAQLLRGGDPMRVLDTVRALVGPGRPSIGIVLSKFDAMHALRLVDNPDWQRIMVNYGAAFSRDPSLSGVAYDRVDGDLLHQEVRSLLHRLHANALVNALENPNNGHRVDFRFFAVSALGASANGETLAGRGIASFRCLDPIKWALSTTGALSTRG